MINRKYVSRLEKRQQQSQWQSAFLWIGLSILVLIGLYFWGVPTFIKLAVWYGDWREGENAVVTEDSVPPAPPRLSIPFNATNSAILDVTGFAEPSSEVEVFLNQASVRKVTTDANGGFLVSGLELQKGDNLISAITKDQAQNKSAESRKEQVLFDNQPPKLDVEKPESGQQFFGSSQKQIELKGSTDTEAQVRINDRLVIVDQSGVFITNLDLQDGENTIKVVAFDQAGNGTTKEIKLRYSL